MVTQKTIKKQRKGTKTHSAWISHNSLLIYWVLNVFWARFMQAFHNAFYAIHAYNQRKIPVLVWTSATSDFPFSLCDVQACGKVPITWSAVIENSIIWQLTKAESSQDTQDDQTIHSAELNTLCHPATGAAPLFNGIYGFCVWCGCGWSKLAWLWQQCCLLKLLKKCFW